jgi:2-hydroxy-6-oxonona-2,4-dienedioate hydrolase/4,5:9,10-diseco-3-hydroxy-5,9,17-trioxoandrosta-1(10),2-diene-4-oate hydrolase
MEALTQDGTSRFSKVGDIDLHYHEAGAGSAVVMLHGGGPGAAGWTNFHKNMAAFARSHRVLVPDLPGFGESTKRQYPELIGEFNARVLAEWLSGLGLEKVHFVGNSLGAHVAMKFALDFPDRVGRLVLMAPSIQLATVSPNPTEGAKLLRTYYHGSGPSLERMRQFLNVLVHAPELIDQATLEDRYQRSIRPEVVEWAQKMAPAPHRFEPLWQNLGALKHRSLLVWGRDDRVVPIDRAIFMLHQMPDVRLHIFGNCGHWAMLEHPDAFNKLCLEFLRED